jgi:hypothetical protein
LLLRPPGRIKSRSRAHQAYTVPEESKADRGHTGPISFRQNQEQIAGLLAPTVPAVQFAPVEGEGVCGVRGDADLLLPEGRRSKLARDLLRSSSKTGHLGGVRQTLYSGFTAASRQIV